VASVTFDHLYKRFDENIVVNDLCVEVQDQEFVVIVGPSGCGKSTTLRMVAGLESISDGRIRIGDREVNDVPPKDRNVAMVFQNYALYPHMNVAKNMGFGLKLRKFPKPKIDQRVQHAAEILGIEELLERKPKQLSGGQRQRVAVGRAIVRDPQVFLFDEPLSNLDAKLRVQMRAEIRKLHMQLEATMLYVTHDQVEAMTMGDRIIILKDGLLQQVGTPIDVYRYPTNQFVAGFIGSPSMNFLSCELVRNDQRSELQSNGFHIRLIPRFEETFQLERTPHLVLGIRPEDFWIQTKDQDSNGISSLKGQVELVETTGAESLVHLNVGQDAVVARIPSDIRVETGDDIELYFKLEKLHLFEQKSGISVRRV